MNYIILSALIFCALIDPCISQENQDYKLYTRNQTFEPPENVSEYINSTSPVTKKSRYKIIQFYKIPTTEVQSEMEKKGITFLEYIPDNSYLVSLSDIFTKSSLQTLGVRSIIEFDKKFKKDKYLFNSSYPEWSLDGSDKIKVNLLFHNHYSFEQAVEKVSQFEMDIMKTRKERNILTTSVRINDIDKILELACVKYAEVISPPAVPEDTEARSLHRTNVLDTDYGAGRHYTGKGVKISINDDGFVGPHIDFKGRTNQLEVEGDLAGDHGDMVAGIAGGAGNLDPTIRGTATEAFLYIRQYNSNLPNTEALHKSDTILIFSSSYGDGCNEGYTSLTQQVDDEINDNPSLIQTFSTGNSGNLDCGYGAGIGWGNITGGHKLGKNVISVGNMDNEDNLQSSSSRGPATDGRIKPDICANGAGQISTDPNNVYSPGGGTSAAAPGIAGTLAQLYQAYKELNGGQLPESALLKASLLNSAEDKGNPGPDFEYGWGRINALRAVEVLEENNYLSDYADQGSFKLHFINIPSGLSELRVMLYWNDPEASTLASKSLVNDLNFQLSEPVGGSTYDPWILDPSPNQVNLMLPAVRGVDNLNNMEQVSIDNPIGGVYTAAVSGFAVPQGPQKYYIVYIFITNDIKVTYPLGGESLVAFENQKIRWDAYGNSGFFTIEYSRDNGMNWSTIASSVPGSSRMYDWNVDNTETSEGLIRILRGGNNPGVSSSNFNIYPVPENVKIDKVCPTSTRIEWDEVTGAASYDVFKLEDKFMKLQGNTTKTKFTFTETTIADEDWFAVRAIGPDNEVGRRSTAIKKYQMQFDCPQCGIPSNLTAYEIGRDSATLSWNASGNAESYEIKFGVDGSNVTSSIFVTSSSLSYLIKGLEPSTTYSWQVRALCNIEDSISGYGSSHTFTTPKKKLITSTSIIFPNPFSGNAILQFSNPDDFPFDLRVFDLNGRMVYMKNRIVSQEIEISSKELSSGMYFYRLLGDNTFSGRFIVEE